MQSNSIMIATTTNQTTNMYYNFKALYNKQIPSALEKLCELIDDTYEQCEETLKRLLDELDFDRYFNKS